MDGKDIISGTGIKLIGGGDVVQEKILIKDIQQSKQSKIFVKIVSRAKILIQRISRTLNALDFSTLRILRPSFNTAFANWGSEVAQGIILKQLISRVEMFV